MEERCLLAVFMVLEQLAMVTDYYNMCSAQKWLLGSQDSLWIQFLQSGIMVSQWSWFLLLPSSLLSSDNGHTGFEEREPMATLCIGLFFKCSGYFAWLTHLNFLYSPGVAPPRVAWARLHQSLIIIVKTPHRLAYRLILWKFSLNWGFFFLDNPVCVKLTKTNKSKPKPNQPAN